jgi:PRC-barrel domain
MNPPLASSTAITAEDIKQWRGQDVLDPQGEKLGKLDEVYYDTETDVPSFAAVKSGMLGKQITLVPLASATVGQDYVRVPAAKEQFKNAPSYSPDAELTTEDEAASYGYYELDYRPAGQGARRLAKH